MGYIVPLQATTIHVSQTHKYTSQMPMGSNKAYNSSGDDVTVNAWLVKKGCNFIFCKSGSSAMVPKPVSSQSHSEILNFKRNLGVAV